MSKYIRTIRNHKILVVILLVATFLRFYKLSIVPVSLFGDEMDVGYHAFSILKTGKDYHGNAWPLHFQSLAEYRTPLFLYSAVPSVAIWGISPLGVRAPAAVFGVLGVLGMYLLVVQLTKLSGKINNNRLALFAAGLMAVNPWHIQYSRAGFEVTMMLAFLLFGLYYFFKALENKNVLWIAVTLLTLSPLIYSTAKMFVPFLMLFLLIAYWKKFLAINKRFLTYALIAGIIFGGLTSYATLFKGGAQRFGYIGVFSDPTIEPEVGTNRTLDARVRGDMSYGLSPTVADKLFHNKVVFWVDNITRNYFEALSTDFLFFKGDPNPRHSIEGQGEFYRIDAAIFVIGLIAFFASKTDRKIKYLIGFWILAGVFPASLTRDGGTHATRLILILPPLLFLMSYGLNSVVSMKSINLKLLLSTAYLFLFALCFGFYLHNYYVHNPWYSERWWHYGWKQAITAVKAVDQDYDRVFISMKGEPAWIFFVGAYEYPPDKWQAEFPVGNDGFIEGFGFVSHTGKYYFGSVQDVNGGIFGTKDYISSKDLYLANASEVGENLITNPEKSPVGLHLLKTIAFPSGEPAFYLFSGS